MLTALWLLSLTSGAVWTQTLITCPRDRLCRRALLSGNDVVLQCDGHGAQWYFTSVGGEQLALLSPLSHFNPLPGGSLQLKNPQTFHSGLYHCQRGEGTPVVEYEIDFQDASSLHVTHKNLGQKPLCNKTVVLDEPVEIFTQWGPWQDCNRCQEPGERKRLGYCYVKGPAEPPTACGLYLGNRKMSPRRAQPELQVEACHTPCFFPRETHQPFFVFDIYPLGRLTSSLWLSCPLASIYRPVSWEMDSRPVTWQSQLSGQNNHTFLSPATGSEQLQIFHMATYKCFVEQELVAQFNPVSPERLEARRPGREAGPWRLGQAEALAGQADAVLQGLKLALGAGTILALLALMFKVLRPAQRRRSNPAVLVT
ncbi:protein FAM187B [Perognathus longimembris pacificus]|uniref:protein FAM187B n=1 Tax=Perognathus longimembris pacificus TaxID=214514 RepID=UPI002019AD43|nr:protein FAM187B [Perognathus longimembris pacificus]